MCESGFCVKTLLEHGADPNCQDVLGNTPLHFACYGRRLANLEMLIMHCADVNLSDKSNYIPLDVIYSDREHSEVEADMIDMMVAIGGKEQVYDSSGNKLVQDPMEEMKKQREQEANQDN